MATQHNTAAHEGFHRWFKEHEEELLARFNTFLRFKSIATDPAYHQETRSCAEWLVQAIRDLGLQAELWETETQPIVFASWLEAGEDKPTVLIYNHYDVQPVDPLELWHSPPFEPTVREGEIYARGAQDNKGQCFYIYLALKALIEKHGKLPVNIKWCIEGEEESGSRALSHLLAEGSKNKELQADILTVVDLGIPKPHIPALTLGLRGIVTFDIVVDGPAMDLHSGMYGGIVLNPNQILVQLLAQLHDEKGCVTIPGFYDDVQELPKEEYDRLYHTFDEAAYCETLGVDALKGGEEGYTPLERAWLRPTLEINGIKGGYGGEGFKTVLPAQAIAKISCRLVPHQNPEKIRHLVKTYFETHAPAGVRVKVHCHQGNGDALRVSASSSAVQAFAQGYSEVFGSDCQFIFVGGSVPVIAHLAKVCGGDTVLMGLGLDTDLIHSPNEHFGIDRLDKGMAVFARGLEVLGCPVQSCE